VSRRFFVEADGGSRGNPGPAAYGAVVRDADTGEVLAELAEYIGIATNNVAEYRGMLAGLRKAYELDPEAFVEARLDSKLVVEQMTGRWQVKHPDMRTLAREALSVFSPGHVTFTWVPRAQNSHADRLVNMALDARAKGEPVRLPPGNPTAAPVNRLPGWTPDLGTPTTFLLLRHGLTRFTGEKRFSGSGGEDLPLTEEGLAQAKRAAVKLAGMSVDVVITSPLLRARQTAEALATALDLEVVEEHDLRECAFGQWDGLTMAEVMRRWPQEVSAWLASTSVAPPGGESFDAVAHRVEATRRRLLEAFPGRTVAVVSHVTPIKMFVRSALDAPTHAVFRMELRPCSLTTVQWWEDGQASLRTFNDTSHLD